MSSSNGKAKPEAAKPAPAAAAAPVQNIDDAVKAALGSKTVRECLRGYLLLSGVIASDAQKERIATVLDYLRGKLLRTLETPASQEQKIERAQHYKSNPFKSPEGIDGPSLNAMRIAYADWLLSVSDATSELHSTRVTMTAPATDNSDSSVDLTAVGEGATEIPVLSQEEMLENLAADLRKMAEAQKAKAAPVAAPSAAPQAKASRWKISLPGWLKPKPKTSTALGTFKTLQISDERLNKCVRLITEAAKAASAAKPAPATPLPAQA